jgi:predicted amidophosphoribosyltransferase
MNEIQAVASTVQRELIPAPRSGPDVCPVCHSWRLPACDLCSNCQQVVDTLSRPCLTVLPISLYRRPSNLRECLKYYKSDHQDLAGRYGQLVGAVLSVTFELRGQALLRLTGGWDAVVVVPSSMADKRTHPLERKLLHLGFNGQLSRPLVRTKVALSHRTMDDHAFVVREDVQGCRILLADDVYTTGARSQSASSALQSAGAKVVGILVVGRRINPSFNVHSQAVWDRQSAQSFRFEELFQA